MSVQTTSELSQNISEAEDELTEKAAEIEADEMYLGEAGTAEIVGVEPNPDESDVVVRFVLNLPNEKRGVLEFSEWEFSEGRVEEFLQNINCTVDDMLEAAYHKVPVTFTEYKGWIVLYGRESKHLESTYAGESEWYAIDENTGHPMADTRLGLMYHTFAIGIVGISSLVLSGSSLIAPAVFGFLSWCFIWYLHAMNTGLSMPHRKQISVD